MGRKKQGLKLKLYNKLNYLYDRREINYGEYKVLVNMYKNYLKYKKPAKVEQKQDANLIKTVVNEVVGNNNNEYNSLVLNHIEEINNIEKPKLEDPKSIRKCAMEYLSLCKKNGLKPSTAGLALAIGVSRISLLKYASGELRCQNQEVIQEILQMIETFMETELISGRINPVSGIFIMKNNHNYSDKSEITIKSDDKELTNEQIKEKYLKEEDIIDLDITEDNK